MKENQNKDISLTKPDIVNTGGLIKSQSTQDFWKSFEVTHNSEGFDIEKLANQHGKEKSELLAIMIAESFNPYDWVLSSEFFPYYPLKFIYYNGKRFINFLSEHLFDLLIFIIILALTGGLIWWTMNSIGAFKTRQVVVQRENGLPAFHKIVDEDLTIVSRLSSKKTFGNLESVVGKYTLKDIGMGDVLTEDHVVSPDFTKQMDNRSVLAVQVKTKTLNSTIKPVSQIGLMFATTQPSNNSIIIKDIILLEMEKRDDISTLLLALLPEQMQSIKDLIGKSEIFVIQN